MPATPLSDYGAIGNCRTLALVSRQGSVDWMCLPHFSGPSLFAALLDRERGGRFALTPRAIGRADQRYVEDTNVLETTFHCDGGVLRLTDFMSLPGCDKLQPHHELVRMAECLSGRVTLDALYQPRPGYARGLPRLEHRGALGWALGFGGVAVHLNGDRELRRVGEAAVGAEIGLAAGEAASFVLSACEHDVATLNPPGEALRRQLRDTSAWWRRWLSSCGYAGTYGAALRRSCLTLKLMSYSLSSAIIAAPTTSLPAGPEGDRNWDYRYCWLRDASLVLGCFAELGFERESAGFREWLLHATRQTQPRLKVLYDVYGETHIAEKQLPHLAGYGSRGPVRVGNGAHDQIQLDVYGEVLGALQGAVARSGGLDAIERRFVAGFCDSVCELWSRPDHGIWEIRGAPRHHTHSKLMCWAALDALRRIDRQVPLRIDRARVERLLLEVRADIESRGFDPAIGSYVGYYGGSAPDASLLLMPRHGFVGAGDGRMAATYRYIERELCSGALVHRYPPDGAYDGTGARDNYFAPCSFWRVDYLARAGRVDEAARLFEELLGFATGLGLYAEGFADERGTPAGNFPQAFTHVELLHALLTLEAAQSRARRAEPEAAVP